MVGHAGDSLSEASGCGRLLLALGDDRDRQLIEEWAAGLPQYEVVVADSPADVPERFDLCLCDEESLGEYVTVLEERQQAADPIFLPCVLFVTGEGTDPVEIEQAIEEETDLAVQEIVPMPVDQADLGRRVDNLLRAREASLRLAERTQQYQELVRLTPEAILLVRDGRVVYANDSAATLFGTDDAGDVVDTPLSAYVPDDDRSVLAALDTIGVEGSTDEYLDGRVTASDGTTVEVEIAGVEVVFGGEPTIQLILRDVTATRERTRQLTLFERAIETANQGITIADAQQDDLPLIYVNDAFEEITGYSVAECLGENCRFLQGEGTDEETVATVREGLESESPVSVEILNYRKDGTPFWNRLDIVPVRDQDGTVTHFLGLQQDVTGRIEREQRLSVLDRVLRHNLRNRGNVVLSAAERIRAGRADDPAEAAGRIIDAMDELLTISDQVRSFRTLITGGTDEVAEFDIVALLERAIDGWESGERNADIDLDAPESARVLAHPLLPFGLGELLRWFTGSGVRRLSVRVRTDGGAVTVALVDHSEMLSKADIEAARQIRETPVEHTSGLEMWLLRWLVTASDGELSVEEKTEQKPGTLVITLPAAP